MQKVKITIIKKGFNQDLVNRHLAEEEKSKFGPCETFQVGQEFIVEGWPAKPEGFCDWAWLDIQRVVGIAAFGGQVEGTRPKNAWPVGCTDALRPVAFLVEPIGEA